ncbi:MAG: hypothetical protein JWO73_201 [Candidatus Taylorbacteria bacterium]|nr:hypothetical protein [Candidatus Taylorbacteria bacterium]
MNAGRDFFLPHEDGREANNKQIITTSDLMIAEVSFSSTGQGIEMGWANLSGVPIICMYKKGSKVSGWLKDVSDSVIEYSDSADMIGKIEDFISKANF